MFIIFYTFWQFLWKYENLFSQGAKDEDHDGVDLEAQVRSKNYDSEISSVKLKSQSN